MNKKQIYGVLLAVASMTSVSAVASAATTVTAEPDVQLKEYVVTATRINEDADKVPAMVNVITAKDIANHNYTSIPQALQQVPGVQMDQKSQGGLTMRGFPASQVLVLVNGMQMNAPYDSEAELNDIPMSNIRKIEVTQGAASSLYGGHAVAGVINIITKTAVTPGVHGNASVSYGTFNTQKKAANVNAKFNDHWSAGISYEKSDSDGYNGYYVRGTTSSKQLYTPVVPAVNEALPTTSDGKYIIGGRGKREWHRENVSAYVKYHFNEATNLKYAYTHTTYDFEYHDPFSYVKDKDGNTIFQGSIDYGNKKYLNIAPKDFLGHVVAKNTETHSLTFEDNQHKIRAHAYYMNFYRDGYAGAEKPSSVTWDGKGTYSSHPGQTYEVAVDKTWDAIPKHIIVAGASWHKEKLTQYRYTMSHWKDFDSVTGLAEKDTGSTTSTAVYAQDKYMPNAKWAIYTGARVDFYKKGDGTFAEKGKDLVAVKGQSYTHVSPKVTVEYLPTKATSYYMSYGTSFNPPELYRVYRNGYSGYGAKSVRIKPNPALDPEVSNTWELGMKHKLSNRTKLQVVGYRTVTNDKIMLKEFAATGGNEGYKQYVNDGSERHTGVMVGVTQTWSPTWGGYMNYTYQDVKFFTTSNLTTIPPKNLVHMGVTYNKNRWYAGLDMEYASERNKVDTVSGAYGSQDAYVLFNLASAYTLGNGGKVTFGIDNLLNRHFYADEATAGRTYRVGVTYDF